MDFRFLSCELCRFSSSQIAFSLMMQMQEFPGRAIMQFPGGVCVKSGRFITMQTRLGCGEREEWEKSASCINAYYVSQSSWPLLCTHITTALHYATFAFMIGFFYVYRGQHFWSFIIHIGGHHISSTCTFKVYMHKYIHYVPVNMYTGGAYAGSQFVRCT